MSVPYRPLPVDANRSPMQEFNAPNVALATNAGVPTASSVITFNDNATTLEVAAVGGEGAVLKWGSTSVISAAGTANFDHFIPVATVRRFAIPINTGSVPSNVGLNVRYGLYSTCATKVHVGSASVFTTQY